MKVYISTDMEGITGIVSRAYLTANEPLYQEGRKLLAWDINSAVDGALEAGAKEIIVVDAHGGGINVSALDIHPKVKLIQGSSTHPRFPYLDKSFGAVLLVGYHSKAGTMWGALEHTMNSACWLKFSVNGKEYGEVGYDAAIIGATGLPVSLVTGDDKVCHEAKKLLGKIETAVVKYGLGRHRAMCLPKEETRKIISAAAKKAVLRAKNRDTVKPFVFRSPVKVVVTYKHTESADADRFMNNGGRRIDGYTVERTFKDFTELTGGLWEKYKGRML